MKGLRHFEVFAGVLALFVVLTVFSGCAYFRSSGVGAESADTPAVQEDAGPSPLYYDFGDVLVPEELKVDKKRSFVYHAPGFTAGVLGLYGRVDVNSLIRFFENNMAKDNWKLASSFKSPRTIMFFHKMNRSCIINITEGKLKSEVEIWVAPTVEDAESTLLK
jgi:hypothetical protein